MGKYVLKRLGLMVITLIVVIFVVFYLIKLMPDYHQVGLGQDPYQYEQWRIREGLDKPIIEQFFIWVKNILVNGDFGYSFVRREYVAPFIGRRLPETIKINLVPFLISVPLGITLGIIAALKKNKMTDHVISTGVMILISIPSFVLASLLQYFLVYKWNWLPTIFVLPADEAILDPFKDFQSRIMPTIVLSVGMIAGWTRSLRAELTEVLTSEFMLLARAKGLTVGQTTVRHALRNAFVPFAPAIIGGFVSLLGGSIVVETAFRINGVGGIFLESLGGGDSIPDYPMVMVLLLFYTTINFLVAILGDLSYGFIDPRIRMGAGKRA